MKITYLSCEVSNSFNNFNQTKLNILMIAFDILIFIKNYCRAKNKQ